MYLYSSVSNVSLGRPSPEGLVIGSRKKLDLCIDTIGKKYKNNSSNNMDMWKNFAEKMPPSDDVNDVDKDKMKLPFGDILFPRKPFDVKKLAFHSAEPCVVVQGAYTSNDNVRWSNRGQPLGPRVAPYSRTDSSSDNDQCVFINDGRKGKLPIAATSTADTTTTNQNNLFDKISNQKRKLSSMVDAAPHQREEYRLNPKLLVDRRVKINYDNSNSEWVGDYIGLISKLKYDKNKKVVGVMVIFDEDNSESVFNIDAVIDNLINGLIL
jgi:hypothetical protein